MTRPPEMCRACRKLLNMFKQTWAKLWNYRLTPAIMLRAQKHHIQGTQYKRPLLKVSELVNISESVKTAHVFTCAANTSTTVHNHRRSPRWSRPTRTKTLDSSCSPLKNMLTEIQHGWSTFGDPKVWPAEIEVVTHFPFFTRLRTKITQFNQISQSKTGKIISGAFY